MKKFILGSFWLSLNLCRVSSTPILNTTLGDNRGSSYPKLNANSSFYTELDFSKNDTDIPDADSYGCVTIAKISRVAMSDFEAVIPVDGLEVPESPDAALVMESEGPLETKIQLWALSKCFSTISLEIPTRKLNPICRFGLKDYSGPEKQLGTIQFVKTASTQRNAISKVPTTQHTGGNVTLISRDDIHRRRDTVGRYGTVDFFEKYEIGKHIYIPLIHLEKTPVARLVHKCGLIIISLARDPELLQSVLASDWQFHFLGSSSLRTIAERPNAFTKSLLFQAISVITQDQKDASDYRRMRTTIIDKLIPGSRRVDVFTLVMWQ